jgi:hypothetical protein
VHALQNKGSSTDIEKASPATTRSAGSAPPPAMQGADAPGDERLRVESERLSIEAVRLAEEAKAAYVRAERKAALAKAAQDAAAIAADAVRISRASGVAEGLRRLDVALAMERSARANEVRANEGASAATVSAPPPSGLLAMAPPPIPPAPRLPSVQPQASPSIPAPLAIPKSPPVPGRSVPPAAGPGRGASSDHPSHGSSDRQAMPAAVLGPDADAFATQLRPRVMGLPLPVLGMIAVGIVIVVLVVLVIAFG